MKSTIIFLGFIIMMQISFAQDSSYDVLTKQLFAINELDQRYRNQIDFFETKYGKQSAEIKTLYSNMQQADSLNLIQVEAILERYGWVGYEEIGHEANSTLFMVIQHSNLKTWQKYFPIMKLAATNGKVKTQQLALLEDRLSIGEGRNQNYGSQIFWSEKINKYCVFPLIDPENVDKRRVTAGLSTLSDYLSYWNIKWNIEEYKKDLPAIMEECKMSFLK